jgi:hypothetical protein
MCKRKKNEYGVYLFLRMIYIGRSTYSHLDVTTKQSNNENPTRKPKGKASSYIHPSIHPPTKVKCKRFEPNNIK